MKNTILFTIIFLTAIACSSDSSQNSSPKSFPVDKKSEPPKDTPNKGSVLSTDELRIVTEQKEAIVQEFEDGQYEFYVVRDGKELVAESSTYYRDEERTIPTMTKIIFLTGGFLSVYWLEDGIIWINQDNYDYVFRKENLLLAMNGGEPTKLSDSDKEAVIELMPMALEILTSPAAEES